MKVISWNCRGVGNSRFRRACKDVLRHHRPDAICLLETKASAALSSLPFMIRLGFDKNYQIPSAGFAGGLWLFWQSNSVQIDILCSTNQSIHCSLMQGAQQLLLSFVYARPNPRLKAMLWRDLENFAVATTQGNTVPWFILGD